MSFDLKCDLESFEASASGAIWGNIWAEVNGKPFPEANWNDMPVAFVAELIDAVRGITSSGNRSTKVRFFDGPFWIEMSRGDTARILISNSDGDRAMVERKVLAGVLKRVADEALRAMRKGGTPMTTYDV